MLILHGLTGIGKTALAERLATDSLSTFRYVQVVLDQGFASANFSQGAISILQEIGDDTAQKLPDDQLLSYLLRVLEQKSYWLQLDSLEYLLCQNDTGGYHFKDATWVEFFFQFLTNRRSQSQIILTSQALPADLVERIDRYDQFWHEYRVQGLEAEHQIDLFRNYGVQPQTDTEKDYLCHIASYFAGHPLILKMIAGDICKPLFGGNVSKYWHDYYSQRQPQTTRQIHQSQEERARKWVNQTLQQLPQLARQMLELCAVFRRAVPEIFYLQMLDETILTTDINAALLTLKSLYLVEETDIQKGQFLIRQHNLIRDAASKELRADRRIWETAERKAAQLWLTAYEPAQEITENLEKVRGYLEAFYHYCEVEDWEKTSEIYTTQIAATQKALHWQLLIWSYYKELIQISSKLAENITSQTKRICLNQLGNAYRNLGNIRKSIEYYQLALNFAREINDRIGEGRALGCLGLAYDQLGEHRQAIDYYQQSLTIAREIGDQNGEFVYLGNLGNAYHNLGDYDQEIEYHQQSLTIARKIGDRMGESRLLGNLGNAYDSLGDYQQAINYHQQHLTIAREISDRMGESNALCNLGNTYNNLKDYKQAINYHQQALVISQEIADRRGEALYLGNLGNAYNSLGQYEEAIAHHQQRLTITREINDRATEAKVLKTLADIYYKLSDYSAALDYCQQALAIANEISIPLVKECEKLQLKIHNGE